MKRSIHILAFLAFASFGNRAIASNENSKDSFLRESSLFSRPSYPAPSNVRNYNYNGGYRGYGGYGSQSGSFYLPVGFGGSASALRANTVQAIQFNYNLGIGGMPLMDNSARPSNASFSSNILATVQDTETRELGSILESEKASYDKIQKELEDFRRLGSNKTHSLSHIASNDETYKEFKEAFRAIAPLERLRRHLLDYQTAFAQSKEDEKIQSTLKKIEALQKMLLFDAFMLKTKERTYEGRNHYSDAYNSMVALIAEVYLNSIDILLLEPTTNTQKYSTFAESFYNWSNEMNAPNGTLAQDGRAIRPLTPEGVKQYFERPENQGSFSRNFVEESIASSYYRGHQERVWKSLESERLNSTERYLPQNNQRLSAPSHKQYFGIDSNSVPQR